MRKILYFFFVLSLFSVGVLAQTNCDKASNFTHPNGQAQAFGADFYVKKCQCVDQGVTNENDAQTLIDMMIIDRDNYVEFGGEASDLGTIPTSCKMIVEESSIDDEGTNVLEGTASNIDLDNNVIVQEAYLDILNAFIEGSGNQHLKDMVSGMQNNKAFFDQGRTILQQAGGLNQHDIDVFNRVENITQGVEVATAIYKIVTHQLTPEQQLARDRINEIDVLLKYKYDEVCEIPTFYTLKPEVLEKLTKIEEDISQYELETAIWRLLYLEYWQTRPYMGNDQLNARLRELLIQKQNGGINDILSNIKAIEIHYKSKEFLHIVEKEYGFANSYNQIQFTKAQYYYANGQKEKGHEILKAMNYKVDPAYAIRFLPESYELKSYYSTIEYYRQVKEFIRSQESKKNLGLKYSNEEDLYDPFWETSAFAKKEDRIDIKRVDAMYLLALGILANSTLGYSKQAEEELNFFKWCNENHRKFNLYYQKLSMRKKTEFSDVECEESYITCLAIEKAVEATLLSKNKAFEKAEKLITEAIDLLSEKGNTTHETMYTKWMLLRKFEIQIRSNDFVAARQSAIKIKRTASIPGFTKQFSDDDFYFLLALMDYKEENFQRALVTLATLESKNPGSHRVLLLESDIYTQLDDQENYLKCQNRLLNL